MAQLISLINTNVISSKIAKEVFAKMLDSKLTAEEIVKRDNLVQVVDNEYINELVDKILSENPQSVEDLKAGKDRAIKHLMGQAMKLSKGKANPKLVTDLILEKCK